MAEEHCNPAWRLGKNFLANGWRLGKKDPQRPECEVAYLECQTSKTAKDVCDRLTREYGSTTAKIALDAERSRDVSFELPGGQKVTERVSAYYVIMEVEEFARIFPGAPLSLKERPTSTIQTDGVTLPTIQHTLFD